jgi:hypothetical protein
MKGILKNYLPQFNIRRLHFPALDPFEGKGLNDRLHRQ